MNFSQRLQYALTVRGLKKSELARELGITRAAVSRWNSTAPKLSSKKIQEICSLLNISANWLILGVHKIDPPCNEHITCQERQLLNLLSKCPDAFSKETINYLSFVSNNQIYSTGTTKSLNTKSILNYQKLPILIINSKNIIIYCNKYASEYFKDVSSLIDTNITEIFCPSSYASIKSCCKSCLDKGSIQTVEGLSIGLNEVTCLLKPIETESGYCILLSLLG